MSDTDASAWKPKSNPWLIAIVVTVAAFMEVLDTTIVNVSLPHIAGSLSSSYDDATWALTSYLVANGIVLTISGWLSDVLGRKRYFMICIGMFTVCSFLCGTSTSLPELIIFRLLQGFFGGGLQPNQQSIILDTFEPSQRGKAMCGRRHRHHRRTDRRPDPRRLHHRQFQLALDFLHQHAGRHAGIVRRAQPSWKIRPG